MAVAPARLYYGGDGGACRRWIEGSGWESLVATGGSTRVITLSATSINDVWAGCFKGSSSFPEVYHFDGVTWTLQSLPGVVAGINLRTNVHAYAPGKAVVLAGQPSNWWRLYVFDTPGTGTFKVAFSQSSLYPDIFANGTDDIYIVGRKSPVGVWRWNGTSLQQESSGNGLPVNDGVGLAGYRGVFKLNDTWNVIRTGDAAGVAGAIYRGTFGSWSTLDSIGSPNGQLAYATYFVNREGQWAVDNDDNIYILTDPWGGISSDVIKLTPGGIWTEDTGVGANTSTMALGVAGGAGADVYMIAGNRYLDPDVGSWQTDASGIGNPGGGLAFSGTPVADPAALRCGWRGGEVVSVDAGAGALPVMSAMSVYLGAAGDDTDEPCYSGVAGQGYSVYSEDGQIVEFVAPRLSDIGQMEISVYSAAEEKILVASIEVVEESFTTELFKLRTRWPDQYEVGCRALVLEEDQ